MTYREALAHLQGMFGAYEWRLEENRSMETDEAISMMWDMVDAIEKQVAKKPDAIYDTFKSLVVDMCPVCGEEVGDLSAMKKYKYCPYCGQKIDWEVS